MIKVATGAAIAAAGKAAAKAKAEAAVGEARRKSRRAFGNGLRIVLLSEPVLRRVPYFRNVPCASSREKKQELLP